MKPDKLSALSNNLWNAGLSRLIILISLTVILFIIMLNFHTAPAYARNDLPWSVNRLFPGFESQREKQYIPPAPHKISSDAALPFFWAIRFFQRHISPIDGPTCPMLPTGSTYGYLVLKKHGLIIGFVMTADRLLRDNMLKGNNYRIIKTTSGEFRLSDPISNNDFWWYKPLKSKHF